MNERERNRAEMPETTKQIDAWRGLFGPLARVTAWEGTRRVEAGRRLPDRVVPAIPGIREWLARGGDAEGLSSDGAQGHR